MKPKSAASVPPLSSSKLDGTPYTRRADVTAAIARMLSLPKEQWVDGATRSDASRLPSEALVFLIKSISATDKGLFGKLVWELHLRIEQAAKRWARGFDKDTTEEIIDGVQKRVIDIALTSPPTRQSDFLEVAFSQAVKRHTLNAVERRRNAPLPLSAEQHAALEGDDEDAERPTERVEDESPQVAEIVSMLQDQARRGPLLRRAQAAVKDIRHYEAILLFYGFGWPYSSNTDPEKQSMQDFFGVSERQIRNWIKDGLEAIRTALENTHDA
jgi:hypothetical protein